MPEQALGWLSLGAGLVVCLKPSLGAGLVVKNEPSEQPVTDIVMVYIICIVRDSLSVQMIDVGPF